MRKWRSVDEHGKARVSLSLALSLSLGCKDAWHMGVTDHNEKEKEEPPPLIILVPMSMKSVSKWEAMDAWEGLITPKIKDSLKTHQIKHTPCSIVDFRR